MPNITCDCKQPGIHGFDIEYNSDLNRIEITCHRCQMTRMITPKIYSLNTRKVKA